MTEFTLTLHELLEKAILREIESQLLYKDMSKRVKEPAAKTAFIQMVQEEKEHQNKLEKYKDGKLKGGLGVRQIVDFKIAEKLEHNPSSAEMALPDIFMMAAEREKAAYEFYQCLAELHKASDIRGMLEELADQEMAHKNKVETLYTEVAFPQTDGG